LRIKSQTSKESNPVTHITTNLRKMRTTLNGEAQYTLPIIDVLENTGTFYMNSLIGQNVTIRFENQINCVATGKSIKKTFGEGLSYEAFMTSPLASPSIIRPELSRIHEGIALRDMEWELENHMQPHYVYISRTSGVKVGVTRATNVPSRWIDQGASEAIIIAETPYRQLAGEIEVALKDVMADKTNWQAMLKNVISDNESLVAKKNHALDVLGASYESFFFDDDTITSIKYPVLAYPVKVKSLKMDSISSFSGKISGIKGQYLLFEDGTVFNVRSHAGYRVSIISE
jgi:Protein of unknown function (DUF2797)